jgi:hypothetical protein
VPGFCFGCERERTALWRAPARARLSGEQAGGEISELIEKNQATIGNRPAGHSNKNAPCLTCARQLKKNPDQECTNEERKNRSACQKKDVRQEQILVGSGENQSGNDVLTMRANGKSQRLPTRRKHLRRNRREKMETGQ